MKRILSLLMIFFTLLAGSAFSQTSKERLDVARTQLNSILSSYEGGPYQPVGELVDVDSSIDNADVSDGNIQDPYGTLKNCYLFLVRTSGEDGQYVIGVFKNGQIMWTSGRLAGSEDYAGYLQGDQGFLATKDLNRGHEVDIVAYFSEGGPQPQGEDAWIYSWDGKSGTCINQRDSANATTLESSCSFDVYDLNGDGVSEILGCSGTDTLNVVYSWNGSLYGEWPSSPSLAGKTYTPASNLDVHVRAVAREEGQELIFSYILSNAASSKQKLQSFYVRFAVDTVHNIVTPRGWDGGRLTDRPLVDCFASNKSSMLSPGSVIGTFSYAAQGLPVLVPYYAQGPHESLDFSANTDPASYLQNMYDDIINNSFSGTTIGIGAPPASSVPLDLLDTLISHKHRSVALGWLTNNKSRERECERTVRGRGWYRGREDGKSRAWKVDDSWDFDKDWNNGIVGVLDKRLEKAKQALMRGDSVKARRELQIFVMEVGLVYSLGEKSDVRGKKQDVRSKKSEVRGRKAVMTSEAYALLKYNAEYLIDRLPGKYGKRGR